MSKRTRSYRPVLEGLETRIVPYALSGYQWGNVNVSTSFMPDGTSTDSGAASNLFAKLNAVAPTAIWQREYARALQNWADVSSLNFHFVSDNGAAVGSAGSGQGDSHFGDIRFGGYARTDNYIGYTFYPSGSTLGGDSFLATNVTFNIGTYLDLYSTMQHETGHALGLAHSALSTAVMYPAIMTVFTGLSADDIAGIQAIYGTRKPDAYDAAAPNGTLPTATALTLDSSGAATVNADLTTLADVDYYKVTAPTSTNGNLTVTLDASQISLFEGKVSVYDASGNLLGTASPTSYGQVVTLNLTGLVPGQSYTLGVAGATTDVFGMGAYQLKAKFGGVAALPSLSISNVSQREGNSGTTAFNFIVTLSTPSSNTVTLQYATADGTATTANNDFVAANGTLTFAPGQTQQTVPVLVNGDTVAEANETFFVNLSNPSNATLGSSQGVGTIQNDDLAPDRYEADETMATAHSFGSTNSVSQSSLTLNGATDLDYYCFTPTKNGNYKVTIAPTQGSGTLNVTVFNAQQTVLGSGQSSTGVVTLTLNLSSGKQYYVKGYSATGSLFMYNLSIGKANGGAATAIDNGEDDEAEIGDGTPAGLPLSSPLPESSAPAEVAPSRIVVATPPPPAAFGRHPTAVFVPDHVVALENAASVALASSSSPVLLATRVPVSPPPARTDGNGVPAAPGLASNAGAKSGAAVTAQAGGGGDTVQPVGPAGDDKQPTAQPAPDVLPGPGDNRFDNSDTGQDLSVPAANRGVDAVFAENRWQEDSLFPHERLRGLADEAKGAAADGGMVGMSLALLLGGFGCTYRNDSENRSRRLLR